MSFDRIIQQYVDEVLEHNKNHKSCHIAILLQGRKVISVGFNQMDRQCFRGESIRSLHAEIDCLRKCRPITDIYKRNYKLLIVKISKDKRNDKQIYTDSRPCDCCTKFIIGLKIKRVYCSNENGQIEKLNLKTYEPYVIPSYSTVYKKNQEKN